MGTKGESYNRRWKTIMLVGATGTGKTTLVDGIVNYVLGVNMDDPFRFKIVKLEESERIKEKKQAESQTEWITCYTIHSSKYSGRLEFTLTVVDTPGFGDTRGIGYDKKVIDQIKHLFSQHGPKGILSLDAICFLNKAPDARLTAHQKYVFQQILSMFGKDVEENICSLITFADGQEPPVLHSLRESKLPINKDFCFNNSALFASNGTENTHEYTPLHWKMGLKSFRKFFAHLQKLQPKSLEMTRNVLHARDTLENTIENIQLQVSSGLFTIHSLREEIRIFNQHKTDAEANKDFEYEIKFSVLKHKPLPPGQHITNCLHCNHTCHYPCYIPNDEDKMRCAAMNLSGNCNVCKYKCHWSQHKNTPQIIYPEIVKKKETYSNKMKKFKAAKKGMVTHEDAIGMLKQDMINKMLDVQEKMAVVKRCNERLKEMALRPNPLSMVEYIDIMIEAEEFEQNDGYKERIKELKFYRDRATTDKKAADFLAIRLDEELNMD
ncbi:uncharacterized protein LOC128546840 [Mercenaria mercenaria]|uniref:uncharacterized protein LOC128546840 n=1 Tax=Mercenaria mercenaria TaxID=6596 RepID=UPI00234EDCFE|nr:uncharacterized protein LOC128546840 [Mercenaria mercenaria]